MKPVTQFIDALFSLVFRIAQQQESARKLSQHPRPTAIPAPPKTIAKTTDLTSSLLQSNLSALSHKPNTNASPNVMTPYTNMTPNMSYNPTMTNQNSNTTYNSAAANNMAYNSNLNLGYQSSVQNTSKPFDNPTSVTTWSNSGNTNASNFNNKWTTNQTNSNVKQDWSAFESLLPSNSNNNEKKKVNENEMMDLLS